MTNYYFTIILNSLCLIENAKSFRLKCSICISYIFRLIMASAPKKQKSKDPLMWSDFKEVKDDSGKRIGGECLRCGAFIQGAVSARGQAGHR